MSRETRNQTNTEATLVAAQATLSNAPFTTAFKAYLGVIAAQTTGFMLFVACCSGLYFLITRLL